MGSKSSKFTHIMSGNIILPNITDHLKKETKGEKVKKEDIDMDKSFSESRKLAEDKSLPERKSPVKNVTSGNVKNLDPIDLKKHDLEKSMLPTRSSSGNMDSKAIRPSNSPAGSGDGGRGHLRESLTSIFNTEAPSESLNSEYTDHTIKSARGKRRSREDRKKRSRDWEVESRAKTTKDLDEEWTTGMGFAPSRTGFKPGPLPRVEIKAIKKEIDKAKKSMGAGKAAAKIKSEDDKKSQKTVESRAGMSFQDAEAEKNKERLSKTSKESRNIKISQDFIPAGTDRVKKASASLKGIFAVPKSPEELGDEKSMAKDSSKIKTERKNRSDDRSWETVENSRSKKY